MYFFCTFWCVCGTRMCRCVVGCVGGCCACYGIALYFITHCSQIYPGFQPNQPKYSAKCKESLAQIPRPKNTAQNAKKVLLKSQDLKIQRNKVPCSLRQTKNLKIQRNFCLCVIQIVYKEAPNDPRANHIHRKIHKESE